MKLVTILGWAMMWIKDVGNTLTMGTWAVLMDNGHPAAEKHLRKLMKVWKEMVDGVWKVGFI